MGQQVEGRPMHELRAIIAKMDARRNELEDAWENLTDSAQVELVRYAQSLVAAEDAKDAAALREP